MQNPYTYKLRPAYGSDELLLEFFVDHSDTGFEKVLFTAMQPIHPKVDSVGDLWMNDEVQLNISSDWGNFTLSKDTWGFVFIIANNNQPCIKHIDELLVNNALFKKEEVDFGEFK